MTERLYYRDAELRVFEATVVRSHATGSGAFHVYLDRTAFYPTSGGQPFDRGRLGAASVMEVFEAEDGDVVHVTDMALDAGSVSGEVDWTRRFDHMQQHSGQHVLSAAFERTCGAATVSFHLGSSASTIDLAREVTPLEIERAEMEANGIAWSNRPVSVRFVDAREATALPLRKASTREGELRLVEIPDFDLSACGGTHVSQTGAIGAVVVCSADRFKSGTRITFRCGRRALESHRELRESVAEAGRVLSVGSSEIAGAIRRQADDLRRQARRLNDLELELARLKAADWSARAETIGLFRGVLRADASLDAGGIKAIAQAVASGTNGLIVVIAGGGRPTPVVVSRSADVDLDASGLLKALANQLGGRGGGRSDLAQGGVDSDADRVVATARQLLASG